MYAADNEARKNKTEEGLEDLKKEIVMVYSLCVNLSQSHYLLTCIG